MKRKAIVPRHSPFEIRLTTDERRELQHRASSYTLQYRKVVRAKMILLAAEGLSNDEIAARLATRREVVSRWRKRFFQKRLAGLEVSPRRRRSPPPQSGSPPQSNGESAAVG